MAKVWRDDKWNINIKRDEYTISATNIDAIVYKLLIKYNILTATYHFRRTVNISGRMTEVDTNFIDRHRLDLFPAIDLHNELVNIWLMSMLSHTSK